MSRPGQSEASAAFEEYRQLALTAQRSLNFEDAALAARAWVLFLNSFLPDEKKMPDRPVGKTLVTFPVHKTRPSSAIEGGRER